MYKCVRVGVAMIIIILLLTHERVSFAVCAFVCGKVCVCYDNVNSQASKILLAVDLWNFENNNKSNESVSFSPLNLLCLSLSLSLSLSRSLYLSLKLSFSVCFSPLCS